jgi:hypothetical protein
MGKIIVQKATIPVQLLSGSERDDWDLRVILVK